MKPSSFQTTIENQFDYICKRAMEDERKNYMLYLSRIAKREVSFSDVGDYLVSQFATYILYQLCKCRNESKGITVHYGTC